MPRTAYTIHDFEFVGDMVQTRHPQIAEHYSRRGWTVTAITEGDR